MDFDPYESWLGIPADRRPPTLYDLLGLAASESDPSAIDRAALRRISKVRQQQLGPHSDVSQEILTELARARLILMDPDRRTDYDAKLKARVERSVGPLSAQETVQKGNDPRSRPRRDGEATEVFATLTLADQNSNSPSRQPERSTSWSKKGTVIGAIAASPVLVFGAVIYGVFGLPSMPGKPPEPVPVVSATPPSTNRTNPPAQPATRLAVTPRPAPRRNVEPPGKPVAEAGQRPAPAVASSNEADQDIRDLPPQWNSGLAGMLTDPGGATGSTARKDGAGQTTPGQKDRQPLAKSGNASQEVLEKYKLSLHESRYLLRGDKEIVQADKNARRLEQELRNAVAIAANTPSLEDRQQQREVMINEIHRLTHEIDQCNQEMGNIDRVPWGRFANNDVADRYQVLVQTRDQDVLKRDRAHAELGRFDRKPFDPHDRQKADELVSQKRDDYVQARGEFERLVEEKADTTMREYRELKENKEMQKALELLGKKSGVQPTLGPSKDFDKIVERVRREKLQKKRKRNPEK